MRQILTAIFMVTALACAGDDIAAITTTGGKTVKGTFKVKTAGIFHILPSGGKLYRWADIDPNGLPATVREAQRRRIVKALLRADAYYRKDAFEAATPLFKEVYRHRNYLKPKDEKRPEYANLSLKAKGLVEHEGEFMTFMERQKKRGLVQYRGKWVSAERAGENKAFRDAFWQVREGRDRIAAIKQLQSLIEKYPESKKLQEAQVLIEKLRNAELEPIVEAKREPGKELPAPKIDDYYTGLKGDIDKIRKAQRPEIPDPVYPESGRTGFPYHKEQDTVGYYIPKYTRDKEGFYHYSINGIKFKSKYPPRKMRLKK